VSRESILSQVRAALGRGEGQAPSAAPPARLRIPEIELEFRIENFLRALGGLAAKTCLAASPADACGYVANLLEGRSAVASNAPLLRECGITDLPGVSSGFTEAAALRPAVSEAAVGITSADYALADTGSLVMLSSREEARMISLLPPVHVAVVPRSRILSGLDELFSILPCPGEATSSMVLITGPSRTADIEQILVRGVHGPGEIHVLVV